MVVFIIAMILILAVALGVCAVVMFGLRHPGDDPDASFWRHTATRGRISVVSDAVEALRILGAVM